MENTISLKKLSDRPKNCLNCLKIVKNLIVDGLNELNAEAVKYG